MHKHSEWLLDKPEKHGLDSRVLACVLEEGAQEPGLRSLLVVRNGFLVGERYYGGASADDLQPLNSITKSVTSVLVGQALQRGVIRGGYRRRFANYCRGRLPWRLIRPQPM